MTQRIPFIPLTIARKPILPLTPSLRPCAFALSSLSLFSLPPKHSHILLFRRVDKHSRMGYISL